MATTPSSLQLLKEVEVTTIGDMAPTPAAGSLELFANQNDIFYIKKANGTVTPVVNGVTSFNGRGGAVTPQQADYDAFFTTPAEASAAAPVQSFNGRTGAISPQQADYDAFFLTPAEGDAAYAKLFWFDVTRYGISPANTAAQNVTAWNALYAALPVNCTVYFPSGTYDFNAELTLNRNLQMMIRGDGKSRTILRTTSTTANLFYLSISAYYYSFEELGFNATVTKTAGAMIGTNSAAGDNALMDIRRCEFNNYFIGIALDGVGAGNVGTISECVLGNPAGAGATGVRYNGDNINAMMTNCTINHRPGSAGLGFCIDIVRSGAIQFVGCDFIGGVNTLRVAPGSGQTVSALYFANCFFDQAGSKTVLFGGAGAVSRVKFVQCGITNGNVAGSVALSVEGTGTGTQIPEALDFELCDFYNAFAGLSSTGASITGCRGIDFNNCRVSGFTVGIDITPYSANGTTNFNISGNTIGPTENFPGNGTGLRINAGSFQYAASLLLGNDLSGNTTANLVNGGTFSPPLVIRDNLGLVTPPVPAIANSSAIATTETVIHQIAIPANSLQVGTTIKFFAAGSATGGTGNTIIARMRAGTAGTIADTQVATTAAAAITATTAFQLEGFLTVRSIGAGGTLIGQVRTVGEALATANRVSNQVATVTINTTVANFLSFTFLGGGTTPTYVIYQAHAEVVRQ